MMFRRITNFMIMYCLFAVCPMVLTSTILSDQGNGLCSLLSSTNIGSLMQQGKLVGWRCEYNSAYGGYLPYEDNKITVCGNRFLNCNSTMAGSSGCSDKFSNITELLGWTGVTCDESMFDTFNVKYLVTELDLSSRTLTGNIPWQLGRMSGLKVLDLSSNQLASTVHPVLTQFSNNAIQVLQMLRLESNTLSGYLPTQIGGITTLESLGLSSNQLSGSLPVELALLTKLKKIELNNNLFNSDFPVEIFYMPAVTHIACFSNSFTALPWVAQTLPFLKSVRFESNSISTPILEIGEYGTYMPELETLNLSFNDITGYIEPVSFGLFQKLQDFRAEYNSLSGSLPATVGTLTRLEYLILNKNQLTSSIPNEIGQSTNLQDIFLNNNKLDGSLTIAQLSTLTRLENLHLNSNSLVGSLPDAFGLMTSLKALYLQNNVFTGIWPDFGNLVSLQNFDASYNAFSDELRLPADLLGGTNQALIYFACSSCNIHGQIPDPLHNENDELGTGVFGDLQNLLHLQLDNNFLSGSVPSSLDRIHGFRQIDVHSNNIDGTLPSGLFDTKIYYCYVHDNMITGVIPTGSNGELRSFTAQNNLLSSTIPANLVAGTKLTSLTLSNNALTGSIPSNIGTARLQTLDLSFNQIVGVIPSSFADSNIYNNVYRTILLNNNKIDGTLPFGIFNNQFLGSLDLSHNSLRCPSDGLDDVIRAGSLSSVKSIGSTDFYSSLTVLRLNNNQFDCSIPNRMQRFYNLQELDLSYNAFLGSIHNELASMTSLIYLSFASNRITGSVPASLIAANDDLATLNLASNLLSGGMADMFGSPSSNLKHHLASLDLSANSFNCSVSQLSSTIGSFSQLTSLRLGKQKYNVPTDRSQMQDLTWLHTTLSRTTPAVTVLDISGLGLNGTLSSEFMADISTSLTYLDISDNELYGAVPASVGALNLLQTFDFHGNFFNDSLPIELCSMSAASTIVAFPGNLDVECYHPCLISLLNGVTTNAALVKTCETAEPTGQPSGQPSTQPSSLPTTQPSGQPTTAPTYTQYDGKFVQNGSLVQPHAVLSRNQVDRLCTGEIEIRESVLAYGQDSSTAVSEAWCIEKLHVDTFRQFGVEQELANDMIVKNAGGASPLLDLSKLRSIMYRGKSNVMLEGADDGINSVVSAMSSLLRTGDCNENGSGTACASSFTAFTPSNGKTLWEDALIACPFFGRQSFASSKTLPIARAESWPYGTAAMIQKVRLMNSVNIAVDNSGVTADNIDSRVASLFRSGTTALVGAYLTQKGSAIGGYDRVKVLPAKVEWSEITTYCDSSASGSAATVTGAVEDLGSDFQFPYANEDYIPAARASALASGVIKYDNVTITHDTLAWSTVDITEIVRNQLHWWYLNSPTEPLELNLLWSPDYSSEDRTFGRTHYPLRAGGDVLGDFDLIVNATRGRTEWYTSESNDPPLLQLFFQ